MGTSTRKKIPRMKDNFNDIQLNKDNSMEKEDIKKLLSDILFPKGGKRIYKDKIVNSATSTGFIKTIKRLIHYSNIYKSKGISGFGIAGFKSYSFSEQVDIISDLIADPKNPELKQSIKDLLYEKGFEGTFKNTRELIKDIIKNYVEENFNGLIVDEILVRKEKLNDENFYNILSQIVDIATNKILTINTLNTLIINYKDDNAVGEWLKDTIPSILKEATI